VGTSLTNQFIGENSVEQVFHHSFFLGSFNHAFDSINKHVEKLIHVLLDSWIDRTTVDIFESLAEFLRIVVLLFKFHQSAKYSFNLIKGVLRFWLNVHVFVLNLQHRLSKWCDHVKLLNYAVHVTDASDVFQSNIPSY